MHPLRSRIPWQFLRFGLVGTLGFVVDAGLLRLLLTTGLGYYGGRLVSFLAAATATWLLNRSFTFRRDPGRRSPGAVTDDMAQAQPSLAREWLAYLALMTLGGAVNYGIYAVAVESSALVRGYPEIGVGLGALGGLFVNYWSAKTMIFERRAR
jgi:putative flippase GtrA